MPSAAAARKRCARTEAPQACVCQFFLHGTCRFGPRCFQRHERPVCSYFQNGYCFRGASCVYKHETQEDQVAAMLATAKKAATKEPNKFLSLCPPEQAQKPLARKPPPPLEVEAVGRAGEKKTRGAAVGSADPSIASPQALSALSKLAPAAETVEETTLPPARTPVTGPVASAFCDALRTWILGQGVTEVSAGALGGFHKSHPQFKDVRFPEDRAATRTSASRSRRRPCCAGSRKKRSKRPQWTFTRASR